MSVIRRCTAPLVFLVLMGIVGCATTGRPGGRQPGAQRGVNARRYPPAPPLRPDAWPIRTAEYVDLWFHGFAMITGDTSHVPLFDRGYRDRMLALRHQRNIFTSLDANQERLSKGFVDNPALVNAEFAILQFVSLEQLVQVSTLFIENEGYPPAVTDARMQRLNGVLQQNFRTVADRDWLRLFVQALQDEDARFYRGYWTAEQQSRAGVRSFLDSLWHDTYRSKFEPFLRNSRNIDGTNLADGTIVLSLPLGGEGRTVTDVRLGNAVAVTSPPTRETALDAIFVFTHEIVSNVATQAITNYTTAIEKRDGVQTRFAAAADVRTGAVLLQRIAPELAPSYMHYYLVIVGTTPPPGDPTAAFTAAFPLPDTIRDGIVAEVGYALGGR